MLAEGKPFIRDPIKPPEPEKDPKYISQNACKAQMVNRDLNIEPWQERSPVERRSDRDKRKKYSKKLETGNPERRTGKERRDSTERRDRWLRVGKWRSESVFDE